MIRLAKDEKIISITRKHWFILIKETLFVFLLLLLPFFIALAGKILSIEYTFEISGSTITLFVIASSIFLLLIWMMFFMIWTDYYLDILILTNKHVIDVEQKGLFSRELSAFRLDKIQDVTAESNGMIQTFLSFGTIHIQTAGEDQDFIVRGIPKPFEVKHNMSKQQDLLMDQLRTVNISPESLKKLRR
ncbi:MAG: PH domain-containing protein [Candidatus Pacebacteria bacterium]|nr:PH domain-containing protein [Candidatus Paceibacterota bacterium]